MSNPEETPPPRRDSFVRMVELLIEKHGPHEGIRIAKDMVHRVIAKHAQSTDPRDHEAMKVYLNLVDEWDIILKNPRN